MLEVIQALSTKDIYERGRTISMCGLGSTLFTTELATSLGRTEGKLLRYAVGSDITDRGVAD